MPVLMLWIVQVAWKKKLALIGVFSLTIIVMIFAIVRVALVTSNTTQLDITWLCMWSNIEMAVCTSSKVPHSVSPSVANTPLMQLS